MRNARAIAFVAAILSIGALISARMDWQRERRVELESAARVGGSTACLLSHYPFHQMAEPNREVIAKIMVERSAGQSVAYLRVRDLQGRPLVQIGDMALAQQNGRAHASRDIVGAGLHFSHRAGAGKILNFVKPLIQEGQVGTVQLGLLVRPPPMLSASRLSTVATVVFLMLAAIIVGYYAMFLSVRRLSWAQGPLLSSSQQPVDDSAFREDDVLKVVEVLHKRLSTAGDELQHEKERNTTLSSRLGVSTFAQEQTHRVLDSLDFGIMIVDSQKRIFHVNRAMLKLLALSREEIENRTVDEAITHEAIKQLIESEACQSDKGTAVAEAQFEDTAPGRHFRLVCRPLIDATGDRVAILLAAENITRTKRAEAAQDEFLAQAAHELLTPLTSIKSYAEMLMDGDVKDPDRQKDFYNTINEETDRLTELIRNMLSASKMETGSLMAARAYIKTDWILDQCLPAVRAAAANKQINVSVQLPDTFPVVMGDKELLKVVFVNILGNAVKYTPTGGTIRVSLVVQDGNAFFEITDTGYGITPEEQEHIFQKFYRGAGADVRAETGSGLGLATAAQVVKLHGGSIDVTSEPGKGSCFTVRLPTEVYNLEKQ